MNSALQSTFLGDILFRASTVLEITVTVAGPTTYTWTDTVLPGTWFASALHLWQYMVYQWNQNMPAAAGQMAVTLVSDPEDANYGKFLITPDLGWGAISDMQFEVGSQYAEMGITDGGGSWSTGPEAGAFYTVAAQHILSPYWPPREYTRGMDALNGYSALSQDGTAYSIAGTSQETVKLSITVDRNSDYTETDAWVALWADRWTRGRAVTFYMDRSDLPTVWAATVGRADVLTLAEADKSIDFKRLVEYKEVQDTTDGTFVIKPAWPVTDYGQSYYLIN